MPIQSKPSTQSSNASNSKDSKEPKGVTLRKQKGKPNPNYVDLLEEDKPIAGQKFACVSFVSPESILKDKNAFMFEEFLKRWDFAKSMEKYLHFISFIAFKYKMSFNDLSADFDGFVKEERETLVQTNISDEYKTFLDQNESDLDNAFNTKHEFQTSVRGLKIRGVFPTVEEAELRCRMIREGDPSHDVFVGPVGLWMPWHPEAYKTGRVEYMEDELNQLMQEKNKNEDFAKTAFDQRVKESKQKAIAENIKKAETHGGSLTQGIDDDGNLIGINQMNTQEALLGSMGPEVSDAEIRAELFEGDNIRGPGLN